MIMMLRCLILVAYWLFPISDCRIISSPSPATKCTGDSVTLKWVYDNPSDMSTLKLTKDQTSLLSYNVNLGQAVTPEYARRVSYNKTSGSFILQGLLSNDTGNYTMKVTYYSNRPDSSSVTIKVYDYNEAYTNISIVGRYCNGTLLKCAISNEAKDVSYQWTDLNNHYRSSNETYFASTCGSFTCTVSGGSTKCVKGNTKLYQTFQISECQCSGISDGRTDYSKTETTVIIAVVLLSVAALFLAFIMVFVSVRIRSQIMKHNQETKKFNKCIQKQYEELKNWENEANTKFSITKTTNISIDDLDQGLKKITSLLKTISKGIELLEAKKQEAGTLERKAKDMESSLQVQLVTSCFVKDFCKIIHPNNIDQILSSAKWTLDGCEKLKDEAITMKSLIVKPSSQNQDTINQASEEQDKSSLWCAVL